MGAGERRSSNKIDRSFIVEVVDFESTLGRRQTPAEPVDEYTFAIMVHLHQQECMVETGFRQHYVDHVAAFASGMDIKQPR